MTRLEKQAAQRQTAKTRRASSKSKIEERCFAALPSKASGFLRASRMMGPENEVASVVALDDFEDVGVHDEAQDGQEEDESDLDEALFDGDAEVAAEGAFDGEQEDVAAV